MRKYMCVVIANRGGPENLKIIEQDLRSPGPGQVRIRVLAAPVCGPDITTRYGQSPFIPRPPFTPGYAVIGVVDAVGKGVTQAATGERVAALTAYGGYSEILYWDAARLIPVPKSVDPVAAAPLILNYIVAYQIIHRTARVKSGDKVLINGASGGVGTAFLQLGKIAGLKMYGTASKNKHPILEAYNAVPIDYRTQDFVRVIRDAEPGGLEAVFEGMAGDDFKRGFSILGRGGTLVGYGNPLSSAGVIKMLLQVAWFNLLPNGRAARYYSTGTSRFNWGMFLEDWGTLFSMLEAGEIKPIIAATYPILEARKANEHLESGQVVGNIVLVAPDIQKNQ